MPDHYQDGCCLVRLHTTHMRREHNQNTTIFIMKHPSDALQPLLSPSHIKLRHAYTWRSPKHPFLLLLFSPHCSNPTQNTFFFTFLIPTNKVASQLEDRLSFLSFIFYLSYIGDKFLDIVHIIYSIVWIFISILNRRQFTLCVHIS